MQHAIEWMQQNKMLLLTVVIVGMFAGMLALAFPALADTDEPAAAAATGPASYFDIAGIFRDTGLSDDTPLQLTLKIIKTVLQAIGVVALVLIIYGGFTIMTATGNAERIQTGRTVLLWTIIGIIIIFSSLGIIAFIERSLF